MDGIDLAREVKMRWPLLSVTLTSGHPRERVGELPRDSDAAMIFMDDLASRLANRVQLTSDGHRAYLEAVEGAFGADVDYAQLVKLYGESPDAEKRYSPAVCIGAHKNPIEGNPDPKYISTSCAERQNLNVRMHTRPSRD
jgi:hypothetical protein